VKMRASDVYGGDYVRAAELSGRGRNLAIIAEVTVEEFGPDAREKLVLALSTSGGRSWTRRVVLNKTNSMVLTAAYGDETDAWIGKGVEIWAEPVKLHGESVPGLKVQPARLPAPVPDHHLTNDGPSSDD
jgi:hypothetical protein